MLIFLYALIGGLFRCWWGGWYRLGSLSFPAKKLTKLIVNYALAFLAGLIINGPLFGIVTMTLGAIIAHNPLHAYGQAMGKWPGRDLKSCIVSYIGTYGMAMFMVGLAWSILDDSYSGQIYALIGLWVWMPYYLAQYVFEPLRAKFGINYAPTEQGFFYDAATRLGEFGLGALIYGGLPLACYIAP